jgi:hypothetical protein
MIMGKLFIRLYRSIRAREEANHQIALLGKKYGKGFTVKVMVKMNDKGESQGKRVEMRVPVGD